MKCPNCQSENRETAKYCDECGFPLSSRLAQLADTLTGGVVVERTASDDASASAPGTRDAASAAGPEGTLTDGSVDDATEAADEHGKDARAALDAAVPGVVDVPEVPHGGFAPSSDDESEPRPARAVSASGPIDAASLPSIDVVGVNVDENGNSFDAYAYEECDDEAAFAAAVAPEGETEGEPAETNVIPPVSASATADATSRIDRADVTADLSGIERLVDSGYARPANAWRSGDTMEMPAIDGAEASRRDFRAPDGAPKPKRKGLKVGLIVVALLLAVAAVAGGVTYAMELWGGKVVPDATGKSEADARYLLESKGFSVRTEQVKSDDVEGIVLLMDPSAGSRLEEGAEVVVHLSVARSVPDVVGKTQEEAEKLMAAEGFERVTYQQVKSNETEGTVLSVSPDAGEKAKATTPITVEVAQAYTVPDVTGQARDDAVAALEAEGYAVNVQWYHTEDVPEGTAVSTDPVAGTKLASGSTVTLNVALSRASELVNRAQGLLVAGETYSIGGVNYKLTSIDSVTYAGNDTVNYTVSAVEIGYLFGIAIEDPNGAKQISGTITFDAQNNVASSAPAIVFPS